MQMCITPAELRKALKAIEQCEAKLLKDKEREIIFHINKHKRMADRLTERYNALKELGEVSEGQRRIIRDMTRVNAELNQRIADLEVDAALRTNPDNKS